MQRVESIQDDPDQSSLEELLLAKVDNFLQNLESRLNLMESYFKDSQHSAKQKLSNSSATSIEVFHGTLTSIKQKVNKSTNLEALYNILEENYGQLLPYSADFNSKLLMGIQFLEFKITQLDKLINNPHLDHGNSLRQLKFRFHNHENAIIEGSKRLLHYYELPFPWRENKYIVYGYRFNHRYFNAAKSVCQGHNETANIWSHILGGFLIFYLWFVHYPSTDVYQKNSMQDNLVMYAFFIAALKCLFSSVIWHTFNAVSSFNARAKFACMDYTGITVLITASIISTEHAALYYHPLWKNSFMAISLVAGVFGLCFTWSPYFDKPESRNLRISFFISLAVLGISAFFFLGFWNGFVHALKFYSPLWKSFAFYLSGIVFYGSFIPERWRSDVLIDDFDINDEILNELQNEDDLRAHFKEVPHRIDRHGRFWSLWWVDYVLSSHNLWHLFVLGGILGHYWGALEMFRNIETHLR